MKRRKFTVNLRWYLALGAITLGAFQITPIAKGKADYPPPKVIDADGIEVFEFWPGEYPQPIIQVDKTLSVDGLKATGTDLKSDLKAKITTTCKLKPAIYHPWAEWNKKNGQAPGFYRLATSDIFEATKPSTISLNDKTIQIKTGEKVTVLSSVGEGQCLLGVKVNGALVQGTDYCPRPPEFKPVANKSIQVDMKFLLVSCDGGGMAWILVDDGFLKTKGLSEGEFADYGKVKPGKKR